MVCLFCGEKDLRDQLCNARESHLVSYNMITKHLKPLTEKWKGMALQLFQLDIHAKLCTGNVCAIEIYYHKSQFIQFCNRYRSLHRIRKIRVRDDQINLLLQCYAWKQISNHITIQLNFILKKKICVDELHTYNIHYTPHST